jgi:Peptidase family C25
MTASKLFYAHSGGWSWLLYDFRSEAKRLGFVSVDSISWVAGNQDINGPDTETTCEVWTKISDSSQAPSDTSWENSGSVVTQHITTGLESLRWIWVGTKKNGSDTLACAEWADFKIYGKRYNDAQFQLYQVKDDGIDVNKLSFKKRGNNLPWRHSAFENDWGSSDSSEGPGTQDFVKVFPNHKPLWNWYKGRYRSRSPVVYSNIPGISQVVRDSVTLYLGVSSASRLLPASVGNGYYPFRENLRPDSLVSMKIGGAVCSTGIGGTANGSGTYPYLLYNLRSEASRLNFGRLRAIKGTIGYNDGSASVTVCMKSCTTSTQPSQSDWINNTNGVRQRASVTTTSGPQSVVLNITTDSCGGGAGSAANIKWVWLSVSSSSGNGSASWGDFVNLGIVADPAYSYPLTLASPTLNQAVEKALDDTLNSYVTLLGVCRDPASVIVVSSSRATNPAFRPRLNLNFSDSKTLLSWEGRKDSTIIPSGGTMQWSGGTPSVGYSRYGKVVRFHTSNQNAWIADSNTIDYSQGMISFWYQMDLGTSGDSGANAIFFKRNVSNNTQFKLQRDGRNLRLCFYHGDTTADSSGTNRTVWSLVDSSYSGGTPHLDTIVNPFDGRQHFISIGWNYGVGNSFLVIDGKSPAFVRGLAFRSNPVSWSKANLIFGQDINGYFENLVIRSRNFSASGIQVVSTHIENNLGYLPPIQLSFGDTVDCIVISPDDPMFQDVLNKYALRNISMGVRSVVVPLRTISANYSGADIPERIRNFLKRAYLQWHPKMAILGGGAEFIPTRKVAFQSMDGEQVSTDRYYGCLEGDWNDNGNQYFAEPSDSADLTSELIVARFPASTWNQLNSMVEKSSMGMGLPPYQYQCGVNTGKVTLTGMKMFQKSSGISDGHYYGNILQGILGQGEYTTNMAMKTYYPNDDTANDTINSMTTRLNKFLDTLNPMPGLWVHYGHGSENELALDSMIRSKSNLSMITLTGENAFSDSVFRKFKGLAHIRAVGCGTASLDQNSVGRMLLSKPHGGALTYLAAAEFSNPDAESRLLQNEFREIADSSFFNWGEVFTTAADQEIALNNGRDILRWVAMSRNFLGDPLLPVRYKQVDSSGVLSITTSKPSVRRGKDSIVVTVKNAGVPIEGAMVGLVSQKTEQEIHASNSYTDSLSWQTQFKPIRDLAFARGITNRKGQATLVFTTSYEDSLTITATHNDFYSGRKNIGFGDTVATYVTIDAQVNSGSLSPVHTDQEPVVGPGAYAYVTATMQNVTALTLGNFYGSFSIVNGSGNNGIYAHIILTQPIPARDLAPLETRTILCQLMVDSCPAGESTLQVQVKYVWDPQHSDSSIINVPIVGPKIVPVITYLKDSDSNYVPDNGDFVRMKILLGNRYPVAAKGVQCRLVVHDSTHANVTKDTTGTIPLVYPDSSKMDTAITYNITGAYDENVNGIIPATLYIRGSNIPRDSINIDLNPMRNVSLKIDSSSVVVDYKGGVTLSWNDVKMDSAFGKRSKFLGYVVMRKLRDSPDSLGVKLLTPWAVTSGPLFKDTLPSNVTGTPVYTYFVAAVDSSFNCSATDEINVAGPWKYGLRKGFPIYVGGFGSNSPIIADHDKDGVAEIYSVTPKDLGGEMHRGKAIGFRPDGQAAIVRNGRNDGLVFDHTVSNVAWADLDGDGQDEAIFTSGDSLIVRNFADTTKSWTRDLGSGHDYGLKWYCRPVVADVDNDDTLEIVLYGMDNAPDSVGNHMSSLYVFKNRGNGTELSRNDFPDYGPYQHGIAITPTGILLTNTATRRLYFLQTDIAPYQLTCIDTIGAVLYKPANAPNDTNVHMYPNSPISVGMLQGTDAAPAVVVNVGEENMANPYDTLKVFSLVNETSMPLVGWATIPFSLYSLWTGAPALANLNKDDREDIVFATNDTIYVLQCPRPSDGTDTLTHLAKIPFGSFPTQRYSPYDPMPQPLVAHFGSGDTSQIIVNHCGDGLIWAFNIWFDVNKNCHWSKREGFPLRTRGSVTTACAVTDPEGDDTLDLVAVDDGGYMYAWKLGRGSVYRQPWPYDFGNVWGTGNTQYKPSGNVGHVFSDWTTSGVYPYSWTEYDTSNSTIPSAAGKFDLVPDSFWVRTNAGSDRNYFYLGPNLKNLKNYVIQGKIKFDDPSAEFGINFYGQWPDSAKKYSLIKCADGLARLYYHSVGVDTVLGVLDTAVANNGAGNSALTSTTHWYNYEIIAQTAAIKVKVWVDTVSKPTRAGIISAPMQGLSSGIVGLVSHAGTGYRYWGPMRVTSGASTPGAYLAYEDFKEDSVVDIRPYTPANMHPLYTINQFTSGTDAAGNVVIDSTGFVLDTSGHDTLHANSLVYRHKPGTQYPVTCLVAPQTNLDWRNYEFSGTIIKPAGNVYDSVGVGVIFYQKDAKNYYSLKVNGKANDTSGNANKFQIVSHFERYGSEWDSVMALVSNTVFGGGNDTMSFSVRVETSNYPDTVQDGEAGIEAVVWSGTGARPDYGTGLGMIFDRFSTRKTEGYCGVIADYSSTSLTNVNANSGIRTKDIKIQKVSD